MAAVEEKLDSTLTTDVKLTVTRPPVARKSTSKPRSRNHSPVDNVLNMVTGIETSNTSKQIAIKTVSLVNGKVNGVLKNITCGSSADGVVRKRPATARKSMPPSKIARLQAATIAEKQSEVLASGDDDTTENRMDNGNVSDNNATVIDKCTENTTNLTDSTSGSAGVTSSSPSSSVENGIVEETSVKKCSLQDSNDSCQDLGVKNVSVLKKSKSNSLSSSVNSSRSASPLRQDQGNLFEKLTSHLKELEPSEKKDATESESSTVQQNNDLKASGGEVDCTLECSDTNIITTNLPDDESSAQLAQTDTDVQQNTRHKTPESKDDSKTLESDQNDEILQGTTTKEDILLCDTGSDTLVHSDKEEEAVPEEKEDELLKGDIDDISENNVGEVEDVDPQNISDTQNTNKDDTEIRVLESPSIRQSNADTKCDTIKRTEILDAGEQSSKQDSSGGVSDPAMLKEASLEIDTKIVADTNNSTPKRPPPGSPEGANIILKKQRLEEEVNQSICDIKQENIIVDMGNKDSKSQLSLETDKEHSKDSKSQVLSTGEDVKPVGIECPPEAVTDNSEEKPKIEPTDNDMKEELDSKSRLEGILSRLGSRIPPEKMEAQDEEDAISEGSSDSVSSTATTADSEEVKGDKKKEKKIKITKQQLEVLLKKHVEANLKSNNDGVINQLHEKIRDLQACNEAWKHQAKEMQQKVFELSIQQQRMKKKQHYINRQQAHTGKPHVQTRTVATQLFPEMIVRAMNQTAKPQSSPTPASAPSKIHFVPVMTTTAVQVKSPTVSSSVSSVLSQQLPTLTKGVQSPVQVQQQPVVRPTPTAPSPASQLPTVRSMIEAQRSGVNVQVMNGKPVMVTSPAKGSIGTSPGSQVSAVVSNTPTAAAGKGNGNATTASKVIDLTDDDGGMMEPKKSNNSVTVSHPPPVVQQQQQQQVQKLSAANQLRKCTQVIFQQQPPFGSTGAVYVLPQKPGASGAPPGQITLVPVSNTSMGTRPTLVSLVTRGLRQNMPSNVVTQTVAKLPPQQVTMSGQRQMIQPPPPPLLAAPVQKVASTVTVSSTTLSRHPAPLPPLPVNQDVTNRYPNALPPKPDLKINRVPQGIVLSWNMTVEYSYDHISSYQLFAYQEGSLPPSTSLWKKVGEVNALPLPMACTLTQFQEGNRYHFAVRAADKQGRVGPFSDPSSIHLVPNGK